MKEKFKNILYLFLVVFSFIICVDLAVIICITLTGLPFIIEFVFKSIVIFLIACGYFGGIFISIPWEELYKHE